MKAIILGGSGQLGYAISRELIGKGWDVLLISRNNPSFSTAHSKLKHQSLDRDCPDSLNRLLADGADVVIDLIAYTEKQARQLLHIQHTIGSFIILSTASVYCDDFGRSLDEATTKGFPQFRSPLDELAPTISPHGHSYSAQKLAIEELLLNRATIPVQVIRPAAIHGLYSQHPREWWFVKRMLDKRAQIPIAFKGQNIFHTSSANNIAKLVLALLDKPENNVVNIADKVPLSVMEIGTALAQELRYAGKLLPLAINSNEAAVGMSPWSIPTDLILDTRKAEQLLGNIQLQVYENGLSAYCNWLKDITRHTAWKRAFPILATYPSEQFHYQAEDHYLLSHKHSL